MNLLASWSGRAARVVAVLTGILLVLIAAEASRVCATAVLLLVWPPGARISWTGSVVILAAASLGAAAVAAILAQRIVRKLGNPRGLLSAGIAAAVIARTLAVVRYHPVRISDFDEYHTMALEFLHGGVRFSEKRAIGYPVFLSWIYAVAGDQFWAGIVANVALAALTAWLLAAIARRSPTDRWAVWLFALFPSQILMAGVQGTEILHATLALLAIWLWTESAAGSAAAAAGAGIALAAAQYVRPISILLLPILAAVPFAFPTRFPRPGRAAMVLALAFFAALSPVLVHNRESEGRWSFVAPARGGWSILVGTDARAGGWWNRGDVDLYASLPGDREREARRIALARIRRSPAAFAALAVSKFRDLWGSEFWGPEWAIENRSGSPSREIRFWLLLSQFYYLVVVLLAIIGFARGRLDPSAETVAAGLMLLALAAAHTLLEVQGRYHFFGEILFILPASRALRGRPDAAAGAAAPTPSGDESARRSLRGRDAAI